MKKFKQFDKGAVQEAVARAEERTAAEIVLAVIPESDSHAFRELRFALCVGVISFFLLTSQSEAILAVLDSILWRTALSLVPLVIFSLSSLITALVYILSQIPWLDRLIIGKKAMRIAVEQRALRTFTESGVSSTKERVGVLLFVSLLERRACILADIGVQSALEKRGDAVWESVLNELGTNMREESLTRALVSALHAMANILAEDFPESQKKPEQNNKENVLSNEIRELPSE